MTTSQEKCHIKQEHKHASCCEKRHELREAKQTGLAPEGTFQAAYALTYAIIADVMMVHLPLESTLHTLGPGFLASLLLHFHVVGKDGQLSCYLPCFCSSKKESLTCRQATWILKQPWLHHMVLDTSL